MQVPGTGLIGPNAVLQLVPLLDRAGGSDWRAVLMAQAGIAALPDGSGMIPEGPVARLHQAMRRDRPDLAPGLGWQANVPWNTSTSRHRWRQPKCCLKAARRSMTCTW